MLCDDSNEVPIEETFNGKNWGIRLCLFVANTGDRDLDVHFLPLITTLECGFLGEVLSIELP